MHGIWTGAVALGRGCAAAARGGFLVTYDGDWRETFRLDIPSAARIYDYLLGGCFL